MSLDQDTLVACGDLKERLVALEKLLADPLSDCYIERILDVVIAAVNDSRTLKKSKENEHVAAFFKRFASVASSLRSYRRQPQDFSLIASLGHGAFGRVQLVREITTGRVCAMKVLKKSRMLTQHTDYWAEREIMARGESPWIVQLFYAFQDVTCLYMVMEYVPGGTLVGWMEDVEVISEAACRFYAAETVLALADLHAMGFIHRDLKPDNLLLDAGGHLKLADFGTAIRVNPDTLTIHCDAAVGTPDYLSPEVLLSQGAGGGSYGFEVDWWALGVLVYEMLFGDTPFYSETLVNTYAKIMSHANSLKFPQGIHVSDSALDFMKQLLRDRETRLGSGPDGSLAVRNHAWFAPDWADSVRAGFDVADMSLADWTWSNIRACRAPFQPHLTSETDTGYFQLDPDDEADHHCRSADLPPPQTGDPGDRKHSDPLSDLHGDQRVDGANADTSADAEAFLVKYPGVQLAFAGFSFSSSHPNHMALLNGLHLVPCGTGLPTPASPPSTQPLPDEGCAADLPNHDKPAANTGDATKNSSPDELKKPASPVNATVTCSMPEDPGFQARLARVQSQLEEALTLAELHANEVADLTDQLDKAALEYRELEAKLAEREAAHQNAVEQAERRLELVRAEATSDMARLEAEIVKWKSVAQSEQAARQSAEAAGSIAVAAATAQLAKRAAEVADRVAGSGSRNSLSCVGSPTSSPFAQDHAHHNHLNNQSNDVAGGTTVTGGPESLNGDSDNTQVSINTSDNQTVATNLLLSRIEEMARRAHRAEATAREATDALEAEQRFSRLYKDTCAEKSDQLKEMAQELEEMREVLESNRQRSHEEYEAARRALAEEQQRSARYREAARIANENAMAASHRATLASRDAAGLRDRLEQMTQAYTKEKANFAATVNKLTQVMSGENPDALELMLLAQQNDESLRGMHLTSGTAGRIAAWRNISQQKRLNYQLRQRDRENKRLLSEINRLNGELATAQRAQAHAQVIESRLRAAEEEIARLSDGLRDAPSHSRQNSEKLISSDSTIATRPPDAIHLRSRSDAFGPGRSKQIFIQSADNGQKPFPSPSHMLSSVSSSSDIPSSRDSLVRHNSFGEKYVRSAQTPHSLLPSPMRSLADPMDFTICGILELGVKHRGRKKLCWERRVARLTMTHLVLSQYVPEAGLVSSPTITAANSGGSVPTSTSSRQSRGQVVTTIFELPLTAVCHVRAINSCDLYHQPADDVPRIFQLIYDRHGVGDTVLNGSGSNPGHSMTLPRKLSFGSSSVFATQSPQSHANRRIVRTDSLSSTSVNSISIPTRRPIFGSTARGTMDGTVLVNANATGSGNTTGLSPVPPSTPPATGTNWWPLPLHLQGHTFQRVHFRVSASCDVCRQPCWHLLSPPPVLQCIYCQLKLHASHVERQECTLPACDKAVIAYFFRCASETDKLQWVCRLMTAIKYAKGISVSSSTTLSSPGVDDPSSPQLPAQSLPNSGVKLTHTAVRSPDRDTTCVPARSSRQLDESSDIIAPDTVSFTEVGDAKRRSLVVTHPVVLSGSADQTHPVSPAATTTGLTEQSVRTEETPAPNSVIVTKMTE